MQMHLPNGELEAALAEYLGIFGGSCGADRFTTTFTGNGLRIWGGWHVVNHVQEKPLFAGKATIAKAREVYNIRRSRQSAAFIVLMLQGGVATAQHRPSGRCFFWLGWATGCE